MQLLQKRAVFAVVLFISTLTSITSSEAAGKKPATLDEAREQVLGQWESCTLVSNPYEESKEPTEPSLVLTLSANGQYEIAEHSFVNGVRLPGIPKEAGTFAPTSFSTTLWNSLNYRFVLTTELSPYLGRSYPLEIYHWVSPFKGSEIIELPGLDTRFKTYCSF